jgi:hypothetical protein
MMITKHSDDNRHFLVSLTKTDKKGREKKEVFVQDVSAAKNVACGLPLRPLY